MAKPEVLFILSIDTEEEWLWEGDFPSTNCSVQNVDRLPAFHSVCMKNGIRPTYFVDYAVAQSEMGKNVLADIIETKRAEIGAHLHPWCNPPFYGKTTEAESHVINLPQNQVAAKLDALGELLTSVSGSSPKSFRSGRWGINGETMKLLAERGYKVDSSVYPFYKNEFFSCEGAPVTPYWPAFENPLKLGHQRHIMELPVSAGFSNSSFNTANKIHKTFSAPPLSWVKGVGVLWHTHLLRKIYLSPELTSSFNMNSLVDSCLKNKHPVIHMYLHSSSLIDGATGLLNVDGAFDQIVAGMLGTLNYLKSKAHVTPCTITEAAMRLEQQEKAQNKNDLMA